jgi:tight adherence protein B
MNLDKNTIVIIMVFLAALLVVACIMMASQPNAAGAKLTKKRLAKMRERFSTSTESRTDAQMKKILSRQDTKMDSMIDGFIPRPDELRKRLERSGKNISLSQYGGASGIVALIVLAIAGFVAKLPFILALLLGLFAGLILPHKWLGMAVQKRQKKFIGLFPDAIDLMVRGLRSGLPITESLGIVSREIPDPISSEFRVITDKIRIGLTMEQALNEAASRVNTPEFQFFIITLSIQRETGGNLAETLSNLSDILRKRQQLKLKIRAMSSEAKASAWIIGLLPIVMFGVLTLLNGEYMSAFLTNFKLQMITAGGLTWMGIGVYIMSQMINFEV